MRLISFILVACICITCRSNPRTITVNNEFPAAVVKPIIDSTIYAGTLEIVEDAQRWNDYKSPPPPFSEGCLVMIFDIDPEMKQIFFSDTTIFISHKICGRDYPLEAYKGVLSIDSCNIAVFDKYEIGYQYYNTDSLKIIPFDEFKCFPMKTTPVAHYYFKNNTLHYWNP